MALQEATTTKDTSNIDINMDPNDEKQADNNENNDGLPKVILGTMEFSRRLSFEDSKKVTKIFLDHGHKEFDTAYVYQGGKSETYLSQMQDLLSSNNALIATKVNPTVKPGFTKEGIITQCITSLKRININKCDIYYLHWPDHNIDIKDTLKTINELYKQKKFTRFGLSNYSAWQVAEIYFICKENGYPLPEVYQGMYNPLTRSVEQELFPCLRRFNIKFYSFNLLAGGLLTGKHKYEQGKDPINTIQSGRFHGNSQWAKIYRNRFWHKSYFDGIENINNALLNEYGKNNDGKQNVTIAEASLRWMQHHSKLDNQDGVILGAGSIGHFNQNLNALENKEPLNQNVVKAFDQAWELCRKDCPSYFK